MIIEKTIDRKAFIKKVFEKYKLSKELKNKKILIKPNVVSDEDYPTTTHPDILRYFIPLCRKYAKSIVIADSPAIHLDTQTIIENHKLNHICKKLGVKFLDMTSCETIKKKVEDRVYDIFVLPFEFDYIISLPTLKEHKICVMTAALKNQFGFLSHKCRYRLHHGGDINRAIADINHIIKPNFFIIDAIDILLKAQEVRHGGKMIHMGYMLAGKNATQLDKICFKLLKSVDKSIVDKRVKYINIIENMKLK